MKASYSKDDFGQIANAIRVSVDRVEQFAREFEGAAIWFRLDRNRPSRTSPHSMRPKMLAIAAAARKLLKHLGIEEVRDAPDGPADTEIRDLLVAVLDVGKRDGDAVVAATTRIGRLVEILDAVDAARKLERTAVKAAGVAGRIGDLTVPKGHAGDDALNAWVAAMIGIYGKVTGKRAATSVSPEGKAGGPLIRFLMVSSGRAGIELESPAALRRRIRGILEAAA